MYAVLDSKTRLTAAGTYRSGGDRVYKLFGKLRAGELS